MYNFGTYSLKSLTKELCCKLFHFCSIISVRKLRKKLKIFYTKAIWLHESLVGSKSPHQKRKFVMTLEAFYAVKKLRRWIELRQWWIVMQKLCKVAGTVMVYPKYINWAILKMPKVRNEKIALDLVELKIFSWQAKASTNQ